MSVVDYWELLVGFFSGFFLRLVIYIVGKFFMNFC